MLYVYEWSPYDLLVQYCLLCIIFGIKAVLCKGVKQHLWENKMLLSYYCSSTPSTLHTVLETRTLSENGWGEDQQRVHPRDKIPTCRRCKPLSFLLLSQTVRCCKVTIDEGTWISTLHVQLVQLHVTVTAHVLLWDGLAWADHSLKSWRVAES